MREANGWTSINWDSFDTEAHDVACALTVCGLTRGATVGVLMGNVPEWVIADLGIIIAGGVGCGLYPTSSAEQCAYIVDDSDAAFLFVDSAAQLEKVLSGRAQMPKLKRIIALDENAARDCKNGCVISYREFLNTGSEHRAKLLPDIRQRALVASPDEIVMMVYTSGTTGAPKGACLSHRYVLGSVESLRACVPLEACDVMFSYLPYCHVAERIAGLYNRLYAGASAYFVDDIRNLWSYMTEVKPTVFPSLPRFYEKIHARLIADIEAASPQVQAEFNLALQLGREISRQRQERVENVETIAPDLKDKYDQIAAPFIEKLQSYFGGRLRLATSGGAPLPQEVAEVFDALGTPVLEAYGLTENVCVAFNQPHDYKFGTVGRAMHGCEIKIADDGEILIKSEMMFSGYYKQPAKTAEMFCDGWLLTGDLGAIDADGFLKITGRKKEIIVTSTGKNIAPALIENLLKEHHLISHAFVYGDNRAYLVALITLNQSECESFARAHRIAFDDFAMLTRHPQILETVDDIVAKTNARVSRTEAIKRFAILERDFHIEDDEITPTHKLKRAVVTNRFADAIEKLYA